MADLALTTRKRGRPLKFESPEDLQAKVNDYFAECDKNKKNKTLSGLAVYLGTTTETLRRYERIDENGEFSWIVKKAKTVIEYDLVRRMLEDRGNVIKYMFLLKCNHGYVETEKRPVEQEIRQGIQVHIHGFHKGEPKIEGQSFQSSGSQSHTIEQTASLGVTKAGEKGDART